MKVGFYLADQNPHRDRTKGISVYSGHLIAELLRSESVQATALVSASSFQPDAPRLDAQRIPLRTDNAVGRLAVDQFHPLLPRQRVDLWHYPKGFLPLCFRPRGPLVGTVCDVILQFYADNYPAARSHLAYAYWLGMLRRSIPRFDQILTISHFSKRQIEQFCDRHRLRCPEITVTHLARQWESAEATNGKKEDFVLHLSSREPHKRTASVIAFWRSLSTRRQDLPVLEIVGDLDPESANLLRGMRHVRLTKGLSQAELRRRFEGARALLLPSEIEGFGLPALEAYAVRTPVVFVRGTTIGELLGEDAPGQFTLDSCESFEAALTQVLNLAESEIATRSEALNRRFSWSRCAEETLAVYQKVLAGGT